MVLELGELEWGAVEEALVTVEFERGGDELVDALLVALACL